MKKLYLLTFFTLLLAAPGVIRAQEPITKRVALVVGVQSYVSVPKLQHSLNDAYDMAKVLKAKGFQVIELYDPKTKKDIQNAVRKYFDLLQDQSGAAGILYYSGHGMQVKGTNYLIPTTADPRIEADLDDQCVRMDYVLSALEQASNSLNIMILDACRNNPFRSFSRAVDKGLNMVDAPRGSYIVYATKPGSVASDGTGRNGLFTSKLLKYINTPNLNIEQVFKKVAFDVSQESGESQRPWIASDYTGDFYFSVDKNAPVPVVEEKTASGVAEIASESRSILSQTQEEEVNFFYQKSEKEIELGNYVSALEYLSKAEQIAGPDASKMIYLRIKSYNKIQKENRTNYLTLKKNIDDFFKLPAYDEVRKEKSFEVMEIKNSVSQFDASDAGIVETLKNSSLAQVSNYIRQNKNSAYLEDLKKLENQLILKRDADIKAKKEEINARIVDIDKQVAVLEHKKSGRTFRKVMGYIFVSGGAICLLGSASAFEPGGFVAAGLGGLAVGSLFLFAGPSKKKIVNEIEKLNEEKKQLQLSLDNIAV